MITQPKRDTGLTRSQLERGPLGAYCLFPNPIIHQMLLCWLGRSLFWYKSSRVSLNLAPRRPKWGPRETSSEQAGPAVDNITLAAAAHAPGSSAVSLPL